MRVVCRFCGVRKDATPTPHQCPAGGDSASDHVWYEETGPEESSVLGRTGEVASRRGAEVASGGFGSGAGFGCLVLVGLLAWGGYWLWHQAEDAGWIPHEALTIVTAKNWSTGEYKTCSEANVALMKDEPQIDCSEYADYGEAKRFKVRFYGATYRNDLLDKVSFSWRCKKNESTEPSFTCDDQKIIKWDEKK